MLDDASSASFVVTEYRVLEMLWFRIDSYSMVLWVISDFGGELRGGGGR